MPLVNVFENQYQIWETRVQTIAERLSGITKPQKVQLRTIISSHYYAAIYELHNRGCNRLDQHISNVLDECPNFRAMRQMMPSKTDEILSDFQNKFNALHFESVSNVVNRDGKILSPGQVLYHGGFYNNEINETFITKRPLSTSFSPHMACQNAEWQGKAYDSGELHLIILRVVNPKTKAFCFRIKGTSKGHEKEVLFASGAELKLIKKTLVLDNQETHTYDSKRPGATLKKNIPYYLLEMEIS